MDRLRIIRDGAFRRDEELKAEIARIVSTRFNDETGRLEKEFERRDTLYYVEDDLGELLSFFLVSWGRLDVDGREVPALTTGLTAARPGQKGKTEALRLYRQVVREAREHERAQQQKLIVWGTTATPVVYLIAQRVFSNLQPCYDGSFSLTSEQIARSVRRQLGADQAVVSHPFVLNGLLAGACFNEAEQGRVAMLCKARQFTLFHRLGIDEARGDRLLFVAEVPPGS